MHVPVAIVGQWLGMPIPGQYASTHCGRFDGTAAPWSPFLHPVRRLSLRIQSGYENSQKNYVCLPELWICSKQAPGFVSEPDQVAIEPGSTGRLQRFDLAAIRRDDDYNVVKRIIGLPGERVEIKHGDFFVDSKLMRKGIDVQRAVLIPVHDSRYQPDSELPRRWRPAADPSGWSFENGVFKFQPIPSQDAHMFDWLTYHHWRGFHHRAGRTDDFPIDDSYAFNQTISRSVVATRDLFLEVQLGSPITGMLAIRINRAAEVYEFQIRADQSGLILSGTGLGESKMKLAVATRDIRNIEVTTFDGRLSILVDGLVAVQWELPVLDIDAPANKYAIQLGPARVTSRFRVCEYFGISTIAILWHANRWVSIGRRRVLSPR